MTLLFFSSKQAEVESVRREFVEAGIPCEVHNPVTIDIEGTPVDFPDSELWIQNDEDSYRALMLCVELGVGFARRAARRPFALDEDTAE